MRRESRTKSLGGLNVGRSDCDAFEFPAGKAFVYDENTVTAGAKPIANGLANERRFDPKAESRCNAKRADRARESGDAVAFRIPSDDVNNLVVGVTRSEKESRDRAALVVEVSRSTPAPAAKDDGLDAKCVGRGKSSSHDANATGEPERAQARIGGGLTNCRRRLGENTSGERQINNERFEVGVIVLKFAEKLGRQGLRRVDRLRLKGESAMLRLQIQIRLRSPVVASGRVYLSSQFTRPAAALGSPANRSSRRFASRASYCRA